MWSSLMAISYGQTSLYHPQKVQSSILCIYRLAFICVMFWPSWCRRLAWPFGLLTWTIWTVYLVCHRYSLTIADTQLPCKKPEWPNTWSSCHMSRLLVVPVCCSFWPGWFRRLSPSSGKVKVLIILGDIESLNVIQRLWFEFQSRCRKSLTTETDSYIFRKISNRDKWSIATAFRKYSLLRWGPQLCALSLSHFWFVKEVSSQSLDLRDNLKFFSSPFFVPPNFVR
jgi:hypothetical protein